MLLVQTRLQFTDASASIRGDTPDIVLPSALDHGGGQYVQTVAFIFAFFDYQKPSRWDQHWLTSLGDPFNDISDFGCSTATICLLPRRSFVGIGDLDDLQYISRFSMEIS